MQNEPPEATAFEAAELRISEITGQIEDERADLEAVIAEYQAIANDTQPAGPDTGRRVEVWEHLNKGEMNREARQNIEILTHALERLNAGRDHVPAQETADTIEALAAETRAHILELTCRALHLERKISKLARRAHDEQERFEKAAIKWRDSIAPSLGASYRRYLDTFETPLIHRQATTGGADPAGAFPNDGTVEAYTQAIDQLKAYQDSHQGHQDKHQGTH